jgi:hypothetical protein
MAPTPEQAALRNARRKIDRTQAARDQAGADMATAIRAAASAGLTWTEIMATAGVARRTVERALKNGGGGRG